MSEVTDQLNTESTDGQTQEAAAQITDLDGLSSFTFQGKTYTPDQLNEVFQGHSKYGETSKYVNEDKNYWDNVFVDIDKVVSNPSLIDQFKKTYPERFHSILDRQLKVAQGQSSPNQNQSNPQGQNQGQDVKSLVEQLLSERLKPIEQESYQAKVKAATAEIDATLPPLLNKYKLADEDKVLFRVEQLIQKGVKMTPGVWERVVREDHEQYQKRSDSFYKDQLKAQTDKAKQGQDTGSGGSVPGQSPNKPKTFADAEKAMIAHLRAK